jgi:hypothetical protein
MMSSRDPSAANTLLSSNDPAMKNSDSAKPCHAALPACSIGRREKRVTPSLANSRYSSSLFAGRPTPTIAVRGGSSPSR